MTTFSPRLSSAVKRKVGATRTDSRPGARPDDLCAREPREAITARIADVDYFLEKGITMSPVTGARPVQLKITVNDVDEAIGFYQKAFGFHFDITRRTEDSEYSSFIFSRYGENDFFLFICSMTPTRPTGSGRRPSDSSLRTSTFPPPPPLQAGDLVLLLFPILGGALDLKRVRENWWRDGA